MHRRILRGVWVLFAFTVAALLAAGCGGSAGVEEEIGPSAGTDPYYAVASGEARPDVVVVVEQHNNPIFDLRPREVNSISIAAQFDQQNKNNMQEPLVIPPGRIRFFLENKGTLAHNFQVRHPDGTNIQKTKNVGARKTGELVIDLAPGNYLIACPVSDHDKRGMLRPLVVDSNAQFPSPPLK